jgi:hypothetical protein
MRLSDKIAQKLHKMTSPKGKIKKDGSLKSDEHDNSVGAAMAEMGSCDNTRGTSGSSSLSKRSTNWLRVDKRRIKVRKQIKE